VAPGEEIVVDPKKSNLSYGRALSQKKRDRKKSNADSDSCNKTLDEK